MPDIANLQTHADTGDIQAELELGELYLEGIGGVAKNYEKALKELRRAAEQGSPEAQFDIGYMYASGKGVTKNLAEAYSWHRKAAENGYAPAQVILGEDYLNGDGTDQNYFKSVEWFMKAAKQNDAMGEYYLGMSYVSGFGVPKNNDEALKWILASAEQGYASAQYILGTSPRITNVVQSFMWLSLAAAQGNQDAKAALHDLKKSMTPYQISEGKRLVANWKPKQ